MKHLSSNFKRALYCTLIFIVALIESCTNKHTKPIAVSAKTHTLRVVQAVPPPAFIYDSTKRYIYLTLDDGPQNGTMNCYHVLSSLHTKASFFMIGAHVYDDRLRKKIDSIRNSYPEFLLANHSYTHANYNHYKSFYNNTDSALRDINKAQASLQLPLKIFRTPGNNSWAINGRIRSPGLTKKLSHILDSAGYKVAGWDVEWHFKNRGGTVPVESAENMVKQVEDMFTHNENFTGNNVVILAHDRMFEKTQYADSLNKFISMLLQDPRNAFETIDHYPGITNKINNNF